MRVLQVSPRYSPSIGGVETHVQQIAIHLVRLGIEVDVVTTHHGSGDSPVEEANGITVRRFPSLSPGGNYHFSLPLWRYLRTHGDEYDLVHAHSYHAFPALLAAFSMKHRPLVITPHYHDTGHSLLRRALHVPYRAIGRRMMERAGAVICVSESERALIRSRFPSLGARCTVIPNGIDEELLVPDSPNQRDDSLILSVGRLERYKRVDRLMGALTHLPQRFRLAVAGGGPDRRRLEKMAHHLGVRPRVEWLGRVDQTALRALYRRAAVLVNLSEHEAFGMTVLEALASGCPVVASDIPAHREIAQGAEGMTLAPETAAPDDVARAIARSAGSIACIDDINRYRWETIAMEVSSVYRRSLNSEEC